MKTLRPLALGLGLIALAATGCIITSAQILVHFALPNPFTIDSATSAFEHIPVDLNSESKDYADNKEKLKGLRDGAILGKFTNLAGPAGSVEVWITTDVTNYITISDIKLNGKLLWSGAIGASGTPQGTRVIGWDESAASFNQAGKDLLINELKGDGVFTLYAFGTAGVYTIKVEDGVLVLVIEGGI